MLDYQWSSSSLLEQYIGLANAYQLRTRHNQVIYAKIKRENQSLRKEKAYLQQKLHFTRVLQSQRNVPRQIIAVDYTMVIDALNQPLRLYLETIRTKKVC